MTDIQGSNNRLRVLELLLRHPSRSRAELARRLGLSRATVTTVLSELERAGMVSQSSEESERGTLGRPPLQVSLAPGAAFAVGLDFGHRHVRAAVCDLGGTIVAQRWAESEVDERPSEAFDQARELAAAALADAGVPRERVIGAGVGLPAPVDAVTGTVYAAGVLPSWDGIVPAAELEARLGMPVLCENDANAGAIGEHLFGAGRGAADMVYVQLAAGIGVGMILGGRPFRGAVGVAGEIGHTTAVPDGRLCRCGNRGCLETVASSLAIGELLERSRRGPVSTAELLARLEAGDRGVQRALTDAGAAVGAALTSVVNLLNPSLLVVGGALSEAGDILLDPIREAIARAAIPPAAAAVRVVAAELGTRAEALGAASIQLARAPQALTERLAA
jgi:glucokinase-like ROK family protein